MTVLEPFNSQNNNNAGCFSSLKKYKKERDFKKEKGFKTIRMAVVLRLEDMCVNTYLSYLEHEAAAYVSLTQSDSKLLRSIAPNMVTALKNQLSKFVGHNGVTSTSLRQKMLELVFSEKFPSRTFSNVYLHKRTAKVLIT